MSISIMNFLAVAFGGALGSVIRYAAILATARITSMTFLAILGVNLVGSFAMGMMAQLVLARTGVSDPVKLLLTTGILGGFTTFSSFSFDTGRLIGDGAIGIAALYVTASVAGGVLMFFLGQTLARALT